MSGPTSGRSFPGEPDQLEEEVAEALATFVQEVRENFGEEFAEEWLAEWLVERSGSATVDDVGLPAPGEAAVAVPPTASATAEADRRQRSALAATRTARPGRARRRVLALAASLALLVVGGAFDGHARRVQPAQVAIQTAPTGGIESLVVEGGTIDLPGLLREAAALDRAAAVQRVATSPEPAYLLTLPVTVRPGGRLIVDVELRLLSTPERFVGLEARGGSLRLQGATVTSWDAAAGGPDTSAADGRAYVLAHEGADLEVTDSAVRLLGYDEPGRYGISWSSAGTGGLIRQSAFSGNFYGAHSQGSRPIEVTESVFENSLSYGLNLRSGSADVPVTGNVFRNNGSHGVILAEACLGVAVRDNEAYGNRQNGIVVFEGSDQIVVEGNRVHDNEIGIALSGSTGAVVRDNGVWANTTGIAVQDAATGAVIDRNRVSGNRQDGVLISSDRSTATVSSNRLDHNGRAGVWVTDGRVVIGPGNTLSDNVSGVRLVDESPEAQVVGNSLRGNYKDGLSLTVVDGLRIDGNEIIDNAVAFSVRNAGDAATFVPDNVLRGNKLGPERVRERAPGPDPAAP